MALVDIGRAYRLELEDGLRVSASGDPVSPLLQRFFEGYDRAFVLPDEREELEGFERCLALNATHRHAYGRTHCELVMVIEDADGTLLGGANFLATKIARGPALPPAAVALNYIYVEDAARGRGLLRKALAAVRRLALTALDLDPAGTAPAVFIEQNDPLRLTAEEYAADTAHSGLDQVDRLAIWAKVGAQIVDFPYVQPALSAAQQPDDGLIYAAIDYPGTGVGGGVDAGLLHDHLESFFGISVLKGGDLHSDPAAAAQLAQLDIMAAADKHVPLIAMAPVLERLARSRDLNAAPDFRTFAHQMDEADHG